MNNILTERNNNDIILISKQNMIGDDRVSCIGKGGEYGRKII